MITANEKREVDTFAGEGVAFTIKANGKAFKTLIDGLYANKIQSVTREIWSNALDSHMMAGCADKPFDVSFPDVFSPEFSVRDYGVGLSHESVVNLYTTLFESTKEDTNDQVGKFGIGSKSPFSYTDTFSVMAIKDGECNYYSAVIGEEGLPTIFRLHTEATTEPNGVQVSFPVRKEDVNAFQRAAKTVALGFDVKPNVVNVKGFEWETEYENVLNRGLWVKMGCVIYPVDLGILCEQVMEKHPNSHGEAVVRFIRATNGRECKVINVPVGSVEISASRENLSYGRREPTTDYLVGILTEDFHDLQPKLQRIIDSFPTAYHIGVYMRPMDYRSYDRNNYGIETHSHKLKMFGITEEDIKFLTNYHEFYDGILKWRGIEYNNKFSRIYTNNHFQVGGSPTSALWDAKNGKYKREFPEINYGISSHRQHILTYCSYVFVDGDSVDARGKVKSRAYIRDLFKTVRNTNFKKHFIGTDADGEYNLNFDRYNEVIIVMIRGNNTERQRQMSFYQKMTEDLVEGVDYSFHYEDEFEAVKVVAERVVAVKRSAYERVTNTARTIIDTEKMERYYPGQVNDDFEDSEKKFIHAVYTVKKYDNYFHKDSAFDYNSQYREVYCAISKYFKMPVVITNKSDSSAIEKYYPNAIPIETLDMDELIDIMEDVRCFHKFQLLKSDAGNSVVWCSILDRSNSSHVNLLDYGLNPDGCMGKLMTTIFGEKEEYNKKYDPYYYDNNSSLYGCNMILTGIVRCANVHSEKAKGVMSDRSVFTGSSISGQIEMLANEARDKYPLLAHIIRNSYYNNLRVDSAIISKPVIGPAHVDSFIFDVVDYINLIDKKDI